MLNILRKNAQSLVVQAIVVIIAVVFIFWGVGTNIKDNPNALAVVNGKEIPYRDFQQQYEQTIEQYKQQFGGQIPKGLLENMGLKEQVLDQLIQRELMRQGAAQMGVTISKESVQRKIQEMAAFTNNGRFDLTRYKAVLEQNRLSPTSFEAGIQNDLLMNRVFDVFGAFSAVSPQEVQQWLEYIGQEIKLAYSAVRSEDYVKDVKVTEEALSAWYDTTRQNYKTPPQVQLQYIAFPYSDDLKQVVVNEQSIDSYYREHAESYNTPEKRRARHILFKVASEDSADARQAKRAQAEKTLAQLKKGGDFSLLASQLSEDGSKTKGGDLGFFSRGQMVPPFEDAAFALKKGELSGVVETPFGFHLIKLEDILPAKTQSLEEATPSIRKVLEQQGVKAITFKKASAAYEEIIRAGSLANYSRVNNAQPIHRTEFFTRETPPKDAMLNDPTFLQAAFNLRKGELSSTVETVNGYAILFIDDTKESIVPELAAVRERVEHDYKKEKSVELARGAAEGLLQKAREHKEWPAGLQRKESDYLKRSGPTGQTPEELRQDAFARVGKDAFPEKVIAVGTVYYLYQIIDSRQGKEELDATRKRALEQQLSEGDKSILMAEWLGQLRKDANIWTNARMLQ
jgi:peptidyl-prolyl cis-trans isomerase D